MVLCGLHGLSANGDFGTSGGARARHLVQDLLAQITIQVPPPSQSSILSPTDRDTEQETSGDNGELGTMPFFNGFFFEEL